MCHQVSCGCESHAHVPKGIPYHHESCCCGHGHTRHLHTKEEGIQQTEDYLKQLQTEIKGVEEHLAKMKEG